MQGFPSFALHSRNFCPIITHVLQVLPDQWTVVTADGSLSAQWEHTILITEHGHRILTLRLNEQWPEKVPLPKYNENFGF